MQSSDQSNFIKFLRHLPEQIKDAEKIIMETHFEDLPGEYNKIVLLGMGGSAIAGNFLASYLSRELAIPLLVNRNYFLPKFVDQKTLVIASSYSGNTEETLSAARQALERKATLIAQTSGGELKEIAETEGIPVINVPDGFPPRQALGYMFFTSLLTLVKIGLIKSRKKEINETRSVLKNIREHNDPEKNRRRNLSSHIAQELYNKVPIVYTAASMFQPLVVRWRNQFNENSKMLAFSNVFPELNHNEIVGWQANKSLLRCFSVLFLRDAAEYPRNKKRLEITRDIFRKNKIPVFEVFSEGKSDLARMFSLIYMGDWVSYHLALLYKKDPIQITNIDYLKNELSKFK